MSETYILIGLAAIALALGWRLRHYWLRLEAAPHHCSYGVARCGQALEGQYRCQECVEDQMRWTGWGG